MLSRVRKHAVLLLAVSLILGLATAGFLLLPGRIPGLSDRLPGIPVQLSISLGSPADPTPPTAPAADPMPDGATEAKPEEGVLYDMGSKVVNLADPGGYRYLKVNIVLEVLPADPEFYTLSGEARKAAEDQLLKTLDEKRPIIEDVVTIKLSSKTFEEVFTVTGKEQLKQELRDDLNARLTVGQVRDIYFTDFMVQ